MAVLAALAKPPCVARVIQALQENPHLLARDRNRRARPTPAAQTPRRPRHPGGDGATGGATRGGGFGDGLAEVGDPAARVPLVDERSAPPTRHLQATRKQSRGGETRHQEQQQQQQHQRQQGGQGEQGRRQGHGQRGQGQKQQQKQRQKQGRQNRGQPTQGQQRGWSEGEPAVGSTARGPTPATTSTTPGAAAVVASTQNPLADPYPFDDGDDAFAVRAAALGNVVHAINSTGTGSAQSLDEDDLFQGRAVPWGQHL